MKVLFVASGNATYISAFIKDQANALKKNGVQIDFYFIKGKGIYGYIKNYNLLLSKIKAFKPDIVHAHYGLSGLLSVLQRRIPTVVTFHGSDINKPKIRYFSKIAYKLSSTSIFVSKDLADKICVKSPVVIPCGVDLDIFYPTDKNLSKRELGLSPDKKYVLFSSSFSNTVKNYPLAKETMLELSDTNVELLELKGYSRIQVAQLMNAVDVVLMTSHTEGSPQFIKEAMACNTPVVSVDVGDVKDLTANTKGCFIGEKRPEPLSKCLKMALQFKGETDGRDNIKHLSNEITAEQVLNIYKSVRKPR